MRGSHCRDCVPPLVRRLGSEDPERRARDEMALQIEGIVDGGMHAQVPGVTAKVAPASTCARRAAAIGAAAPLAQTGEGLDSNDRIERTLTSSLWISLVVQSSSGEPSSELTD